jgi:hypothetical protein
MISARTLNILSLLLLAQSLPCTSRAQMPYDGDWDVTVETKAGSCEQAGSGKWNAASAGKTCSGRWEATKENK